jgi:hypothetical protein
MNSTTRRCPFRPGDLVRYVRHSSNVIGLNIGENYTIGTYQRFFETYWGVSVNENNNYWYTDAACFELITNTEEYANVQSCVTSMVKSRKN